MRDEILRWHLPLLAGALPLLAGGFWLSGVANRLSFAAWGAVAALAWFAVLRTGLARGWGRARRAGALLLTAAIALAALDGLFFLHAEAVDAGFRAVASASLRKWVETLVRLAAIHLAILGAVVGRLGRRAVRPEASR